MAGNTFGKLFTATTFGESHGVSIGCIVDGCPPQLELCAADIQAELDKRKPNVNQYTTARTEQDLVEIVSGVFQGKTTGTPIALIIKNKDHKSSDYSKLQDKFRPGHADYTYLKKYGIRDHRGGGRASARETAMRVAAGAIAAKYLRLHCGIKINSYITQIGTVVADKINLAAAANNPFRFADNNKVGELEQLFASLRERGDSVGAKISVTISNVPVGLGEPVFDKIDADLAKAWMSINAAKAVSFGLGLDAATAYGSNSRDALTQAGFASNFAGGILGGITTGQDITGSIFFKPTSSVKEPITTINTANQEQQLTVGGRHDPCVAIRATPIVDAMSAIVILDHLLRNRAQNYDSII